LGYSGPYMGKNSPVRGRNSAIHDPGAPLVKPAHPDTKDKARIVVRRGNNTYYRSITVYGLDAISAEQIIRKALERTTASIRRQRRCVPA